MPQWTYRGAVPVEQPTLRREWAPCETKPVAEGEDVPTPGEWVAEPAAQTVDEQPAPAAEPEQSSEQTEQVLAAEAGEETHQ